MVQIFALEMYEISQDLSPSITCNAFNFMNETNFRQISQFSRHLVKSFYHGTASNSCLGPRK